MPVEPGDGGVGHSWFAIELTSEEVVVVEPPPPPPPPPAPVFRRPTPGEHRPVIERHTDRFPAEFRVVVNNTDRFPGYFIVRKKERVTAEFAIVKHNEDRSEAMLSVSDHMAKIRRDDDEILTIIT